MASCRLISRCIKHCISSQLESLSLNKSCCAGLCKRSTVSQVLTYSEVLYSVLILTENFIHNNMWGLSCCFKIIDKRYVLLKIFTKLVKESEHTRICELQTMKRSTVSPTLLHYMKIKYVNRERKIC